MKFLFQAAIYGSFCLLCACSPASSKQNKAAGFNPSPKPVIQVPEGQDYTFGYLEVPENRSIQNGKTIKLPVYIFKSRGDNPAPDPILYTVGGPGRTSMRAAAYMKYYRYLEDRDLILFEQRGTTYALPHLDCPEWSEAVYRANFPDVSEQEADSLRRRAAIDCRNRLLAKDIDLNGYHTNAIAADIEDLRKALGIEKYNLLTISYSTKIAQVLMRDYPEGIRSVVMDSPLPLEVNYEEQSVQNLLESYEKLFTDCAKDPDCNTAFPALKDRFFNFLTEKTKDPLVVKVKNPNKDREETFYLQGKDLINLLGTSYTGAVPEIPLRIQRVLSGELGGIQEQLESLLESPSDGAGTGMRLSVWCAEEMPFVSQEVIREETVKYPAVAGLSPMIYAPEICEIWGVTPRSAKENQAIKSDIPTLLISGSYDNETPPKWAAQMQANLSNSYHLVFEGWQHTPTTYWDNPCGMQTAQAFFNQPDQRPDLPCFQELGRTKFTTLEEPGK